jgi:hypothetical protein
LFLKKIFEGIGGSPPPKRVPSGDEISKCQLEQFALKNEYEKMEPTQVWDGRQTIFPDKNEARRQKVGTYSKEYREKRKAIHERYWGKGWGDPSVPVKK